jgi:hypothetical protein
MAYIGRGTGDISNASVLDVITFTNSAGPYNLTQDAAAFVPVSAAALIISVDGVIQSPATFSINGSTITFTSSMASSQTNDFIIHNGFGLIVTPGDGTVNTASIVDLAVTTDKLANGAVTEAKLSTPVSNSALTGNGAITINSTSVALGGSINVQAVLGFPTFTSISPTVADNAQTTFTIVGTNFVAGAHVDFILSSGAIIPADSVTIDSATQITAVATLATDGVYYIRIENTDGLAVRSSSAVLTISDVPAWQTAGGSLGSVAGNFNGTIATVSATGDTIVYSESTNVLTNASLANCTLNTSTGVISSTDFGGSATSATTYSFTLVATDAQNQASSRNFTLSSSYSIGNSGQFN